MHPKLAAQLRAHLGLDPENREALAELDPKLRSLFTEISRAYQHAEVDAAPSRVRPSLAPASLPWACMKWDLNWRVVEWNDAAEGVFKVGSEVALGTACLESLVLDQDRVALGYALARLLGGGQPEPLQVRHRRADGVKGRSEWSLLLDRGPKGEPLGVISMVRDLTDLHVANRGRKRAEARLALLARGSRDGLWELDVDREVAAFSKRCLQMLGRGEADRWSNLADLMQAIHPTERAAAIDAMHRFIEQGDSGDHLDMRWRMVHFAGRTSWIQVRASALRSSSGRARSLAGSMTDVTGRKENEDRLLRASRLDALTGIPNRRHFLSELDAAIQTYKHDSRRQFAVLFVDLDRFKIINDARGHAVGDEVLRQIGTRLADSVRRGDQVGRLGGDEFALLLNNVSSVEEALQTSERVTRSIRRPIDVAGATMTLGASIGVVMSDARFDRAEAMIEDADIAMYKAKCASADHTVVFDRAMHDEVLKRGQLESDLRGVCERDELWLAFQPIYCLESGQPRALEALLRWNHPQRGQISPGEFIPLAEDCSVVVELGNWVLDQVMRLLNMWEPYLPRDFYVSVNFSARHLHQPGLVEDLLGRMRKASVMPCRLGIEVTESSVLQDEDAAATILKLRALGVRVLMDDFGTGYSSVSSLHEHQFDVIKIDKSFVQDTGMRGQAFLRALIALSRSVGTKVVAEGIEGLDQLNLLKELGAEFGQGFLLARPMEPTEVTRFLRLARFNPREAQAGGRAYWAS